MLIILTSLAFATPLTDCGVQAYAAQVAKVWSLAKTGRKSSDGMVVVAKDPVSIPHNSIHYMVPTNPVDGYDYLIQTKHQERYLELISWHSVPGPPAGMIAPFIIQLTREGAIIDGPKGLTCEEAGSLAVEFFAHLPK